MGKRKPKYYPNKRVSWFKIKKDMISYHRKKILEGQRKDAQDLMTCDVGASVNDNDLVNNLAVSDKINEEHIVEQELTLTLEENRNNETGKSTNDSDYELTIETEVFEEEELIIEGNRIVDFAYIYEQLLEISQHNSPLGCSLNCLKLTKEIKKGFLSIFRFTCKMCNLKFMIHNCKKPDNEVELNINENVVSCFMSIGSAFAGLEQVSSSFNIPCMSSKLFAKCHTKVCELWELAKEKTMIEAGKEEYNLAILNGDVDENGVPKIVVDADACWSKRSYRKNYNALSGAAVIIGYRTKKVLYMAVKNKYCMVCARSENKKQEIPDHICFKNYNGSSSGMESTALVEGFKSSMDTHGLIYAKLIADGDSSTHKKIEMAKPYGNLLVEKIECTNHLLRNYRTKLDELTKNTCYPLQYRKAIQKNLKRVSNAGNYRTKLDELTKNTCYPLQYRKAIQKNLKRFSNAVTGAVDHISKKDINFAEKVIELKQDLLNGPHHIFGDHSSCKEYFCDRISNEAPTEERYLGSYFETIIRKIFLSSSLFI